MERSDLADITNVAVAMYMPLVSAVDLCSKHPVLDVAAILGGVHIGWQVVIRMLALMVLERLRGHSDVLAYWRCVHPMVCFLEATSASCHLSTEPVTVALVKSVAQTKQNKLRVCIYSE